MAGWWKVCVAVGFGYALGAVADVASTAAHGLRGTMTAVRSIRAPEPSESASEKKVRDRLVELYRCILANEYSTIDFHEADKGKPKRREACLVEAREWLYRIRRSQLEGEITVAPMEKNAFLDLEARARRDGTGFVRAMNLDQVFSIVRYCDTTPSPQTTRLVHRVERTPKNFDEIVNAAVLHLDVVVETVQLFTDTPVCEAARRALGELPPSEVTKNGPFAKTLENLSPAPQGLLWLDLLAFRKRTQRLRPLTEAAKVLDAFRGTTNAESRLEAAFTKAIEERRAEVLREFDARLRAETDPEGRRRLLRHRANTLDALNDAADRNQRKWFIPKVDLRSGAMTIAPTPALLGLQLQQSTARSMATDGYGRYAGPHLVSLSGSAEESLWRFVADGTRLEELMGRLPAPNHSLKSVSSPFEPQSLSTSAWGAVFDGLMIAYEEQDAIDWMKSAGRKKEASPIATLLALRKGNVQGLSKQADLAVRRVDTPRDGISSGILDEWRQAQDRNAASPFLEHRGDDARDLREAFAIDRAQTLQGYPVARKLIANRTFEMTEPERFAAIAAHLVHGDKSPLGEWIGTLWWLGRDGALTRSDIESYLTNSPGHPFSTMKARDRDVLFRLVEIAVRSSADEETVRQRIRELDAARSKVLHESALASSTERAYEFAGVPKRDAPHVARVRSARQEWFTRVATWGAQSSLGSDEIRSTALTLVPTEPGDAELFAKAQQAALAKLLARSAGESVLRSWTFGAAARGKQ